MNDLERRAYERERHRLPRECCATMKQQFAEAANHHWHNGFWPMENGEVTIGVDGEWNPGVVLKYCPFCGQEFDFS